MTEIKLVENERAIKYSCRKNIDAWKKIKLKWREKPFDGQYPKRVTDEEFQNETVTKYSWWKKLKSLSSYS